MKETQLYYLGFSTFVGIGPIKFDFLIRCFGSPEKAYTASAQDLSPLIGQKLTDAFIQFRNSFKLQSEWDRIEKKGIHIIPRTDSRYPPQFHELPDSPICLYAKGDIDSYDFASDLFFSIVGTRSPTDYGVQITRKFSRELTTCGFTIVSGMALGIDTHAHTSCLDADGRTIAFLGCGVEVIYPYSNRSLYHRIIQNGGLIMSEFHPELTVRRGLFVSRNRLISGLSKGVLVAEGLKDSGSLVTARCALDQGKEVFAPPAPITSSQSQAPNLLLKEGAKLVTCKEDILEEFKMSVKSKTYQDMSKKLGIKEKLVYDLLKKEPFSCDEIARALNIPIYQILTYLSGMELMGIIEKGIAGKYQIKI